MRSNRSLRVLVLLAAVTAAAAVPARAQSLLAARGLGYSIEPLDARARALGGVGLGLPGVGLSLVNPAGAAGVPVPALLVTFQQDWNSAALPGEESDASTARFPLIQAAFPVGASWTASVGYGALLDQSWAVERQDTLRFSGRVLPVTDRFSSQGGIGRFRAGAAYAVTERLALGAAVDLYSGAVRDTASRFFPRDTVQTDLLVPAVTGREWTYRGVGGAVGIRWHPIDPVHLAAAVSAGGTLEAEPVGDTAALGRSYPIPLRVHGGASGRVAQGAVVALAGEWTGWSTADDELAGVGGARDAWTVSSGLEWGSPSPEGRASYPLRLGARYSALPFRWHGAADFPSERALTGGIGARLAGGAALADLAVERGWRGGGESVLDESYWRVSVSLLLLGR